MVIRHSWTVYWFVFNNDVIFDFIVLCWSSLRAAICNKFVFVVCLIMWWHKSTIRRAYRHVYTTTPFRWLKLTFDVSAAFLQRTHKTLDTRWTFQLVFQQISTTKHLTHHDTNSYWCFMASTYRNIATNITRPKLYYSDLRFYSIWYFWRFNSSFGDLGPNPMVTNLGPLLLLSCEF